MLARSTFELGDLEGEIFVRGEVAQQKLARISPCPKHSLVLVGVAVTYSKAV